MNKEYLKAYKIGDFFEKTVALFKQSWKKNLIFGAIVLLPVAIIQGISAIASAESFLTILQNLPDLLSKGSNGFPDFFQSYSEASGSSGGVNWIQTLFLLLILLILRSFIMLYAFKLIKGEDPGIPEMAGEVLRKKLFRLIGQGILQVLILVGVGLIFGLVGGISSFVLGILRFNMAIVVFLTFIFIVAAVFVSIRLMYMFFLAPMAILFEDITVMESFSKSMKLMKNNLLRVFLISLVVSLGLSFAITIATTPLSTIAYLPYYQGIFKLYSGTLDGGESLSLIREVVEKLKSMSVLIILISYISILAEYLIYPLFQALLYIDVKFRKNDFPPVRQQVAEGYNYAPGSDQPYSASVTTGSSSVDEDITVDESTADSTDHKPKEQDD